jgi:hypothetical protein
MLRCFPPDADVLLLSAAMPTYALTEAGLPKKIPNANPKDSNDSQQTSVQALCSLPEKLCAEESQDWSCAGSTQGPNINERPVRVLFPTAFKRSSDEQGYHSQYYKQVSRADAAVSRAPVA